MYINQIPYGTKIKISSETQNCSIDFYTNAAELMAEEQSAFKGIKDSCVVVNTVIDDGKTVGFPNNDEIQYIVSCAINGKVYFWKGVEIKLYKMDNNKTFHIIFSKEDASPINRRENYRVGLNYDAYVNIGLSDKKYKANILDISIGGLGAIIQTDENIRIGDLLHASFEDPKENEIYKIGGIVVRLEDRNGKKFVGCKITISDNRLLKFINRKQMEKQRHLKLGI